MLLIPLRIHRVPDSAFASNDVSRRTKNTSRDDELDPSVEMAIPAPR